MGAIGQRILLVTGIAVFAAAGLLLHYKERDSYLCQTCFERKDVFQWRLGSWSGDSMPLSPTWERTSNTHFLHDFFPANHAHTWIFAQGSPYYFFGTRWGGCAIGGASDVSPFCQLYESSPEFRGFVQSRLKDGSLTISNLLASVSRPRADEPSPLTEQADALVQTFLRQ